MPPEGQLDTSLCLGQPLSEGSRGESVLWPLQPTHRPQSGLWQQEKAASKEIQELARGSQGNSKCEEAGLGEAWYESEELAALSQDMKGKNKSPILLNAVEWSWVPAGCPASFRSLLGLAPLALEEYFALRLSPQCFTLKSEFCPIQKKNQGF